MSRRAACHRSAILDYEKALGDSEKEEARTQGAPGTCCDQLEGEVKEKREKESTESVAGSTTKEHYHEPKALTQPCLGCTTTSLIPRGPTTLPTGPKGSAANISGHPKKLLVHAQPNQSCASANNARNRQFNVVAGKNDKAVFSEREGD